MSEEKQVKIKIKPLCGIGGYGNAGDVVMMPLSLAKQYEQEGLLIILKKGEGDGGEAVPSNAQDPE